MSEQKKGHKGVKSARLDLVPPEWLWGVSLVYGFGASKYAERNWERGFEWMKCFGACLRHMFLWLAGQNYDKESGLHHLLHASWMLAALYTFQVRKLGADDRPSVPFEAMEEYMVAELLNPEDIEAARRGE